MKVGSRSSCNNRCEVENLHIPFLVGSELRLNFSDLSRHRDFCRGMIRTVLCSRSQVEIETKYFIQ